MEERKEEIRPLDKVERAELAVKKFEEAEKRIDEKIAKLTELEANRLLGSTAGGHIEAQPEAKNAKAIEFFKGTEIEKAIKKHG
jgi:hypothetical protein